MERDIPCGGWCPKGRKSEDGTIPDRYPLQETDSTDYRVRTRHNVRDSDATLVVTRGGITGGTAETVIIARDLGKPCRVIDLDERIEIAPVVAWLRENKVNVLNIAGPRESKCHGVHADALEYLRQLFSECR